MVNEIKAITSQNQVPPIHLKEQKHPEDSAIVRIGTRDEATETQTPWTSQFLRERIETIPGLRRDMEGRGIEVEAAMDLWALFKLYNGIKFLNSLADSFGLFDPSGRKANLKAVGEKLEVIWDDDLLSEDQIKRDKAVEAIKNSSINTPELLTFQLERAFRDLILACKEKETEPGVSFKIKSEIIILGLGILCTLSVLEGLYQRDDIGHCSLATDKNTNHGWQYNNKNSMSVGEDFSKENSWYGHKDASKLFTSLVENWQTNREQSPWRYNRTRAEYFCTESLKRIFLLNWNTPVYGIKIPLFKNSKSYRGQIYEAIQRTLRDGNGNVTLTDPLFLRTPAPQELQSKVKQLKLGLVRAYTLERAVMECYAEVNTSNSYNREQTSWDILETLGEILSLSSDIPISESLDIPEGLKERNQLIDKLRTELGEPTPLKK